MNQGLCRCSFFYPGYLLTINVMASREDRDEDKVDEHIPYQSELVALFCFHTVT
jgi:hypothetical protein